MIVTGVAAHVTPEGARFLKRRLPKRLRAKLDDSKRLVSHQDFGLGEAWARALCGPTLTTPQALLSELSLESDAELHAPCPSKAAAQCWTTTDEVFQAERELVAELRGDLLYLESRGVRLAGVRSSILCSKVLNIAWRANKNRFVSDLHAMERLILAFRKQADQDVVAVCGKVGGMLDYSKFFGPLGGWLHAVMETTKDCSRYSFPGLGEIAFVKDADAKHPLVMLASVVGKYVRELTMARVARFYPTSEGDSERPSGYHDPVTQRFIERTTLVRKRRGIPQECFERLGPSTPSRPTR